MLKEEILDKLINVPVDFSGIAICETYYMIKDISQSLDFDNSQLYGFNQQEYIPHRRTHIFNIEIEILHTDINLSNKNYE